jgi:glycosyltransferase involved in cell wall biosynthesis
VCSRLLEFTTSYHTRFPQYVRKRLPIPEAVTYALLRRHHSQATRTLVPTAQQRSELVALGFRNVVLWTRGVDTGLFRPRGRDHLPFARPIFGYVGRVAVEKNLAAFLDLDLSGTKIVIGDGPDRPVLESCYPSAVFLGFKLGVELAEALSSADVLVFPSRTDTFGLVLLEAMACGTPVAAYPVTGPIDVVAPGITGVLDEDLHKAAVAALAIDREGCRRAPPNGRGSALARNFSVTSCARVTATISLRALPRRPRRDVRARATRGCRSEPAAPRDRSGSRGGTRLGGAERASPRAGARAPTTSACVGVGPLCSCRCVSRVSLPCGARIVRTAYDGSVTVG